MATSAQFGGFQQVQSLEAEDPPLVTFRLTNLAKNFAKNFAKNGDIHEQKSVSI